VPGEPRRAIRAALSDAARFGLVECHAGCEIVMPAGSRLVATYAEPDTGGETSMTLARKWMLRWAGEPHVGLLERVHMAALLEKTGWRVRTDEGLDDLAQRFSDGPADAAHTIRERVVLAEKV
jgi:O-methyltransferase involved in polyketide biosynthesis